jgi:hypothetical protein
MALLMTLRSSDVTRRVVRDVARSRRAGAAQAGAGGEHRSRRAARALAALACPAWSSFQHVERALFASRKLAPSVFSGADLEHGGEVLWRDRRGVVRLHRMTSNAEPYRPRCRVSGLLGGRFVVAALHWGDLQCRTLQTVLQKVSFARRTFSKGAPRARTPAMGVSRRCLRETPRCSSWSLSGSSGAN